MRHQGRVLPMVEQVLRPGIAQDAAGHGSGLPGKTICAPELWGCKKNAVIVFSVWLTPRTKNVSLSICSLHALLELPGIVDEQRIANDRGADRCDSLYLPDRDFDRLDDLEIKGQCYGVGGV